MNSFLANHKLHHIIGEVAVKGQEEFLESLNVVSINHHHSLSLCAVCGEETGRGKSAWAIANQAGKPMFMDRFDTEECARHALCWIHGIWDKYVEHVVDVVPVVNPKKFLFTLGKTNWFSVLQIQPLVEFARTNEFEE